MRGWYLWVLSRRFSSSWCRCWRFSSNSLCCVRSSSSIRTCQAPGEKVLVLPWGQNSHSSTWWP